ncbi:unnamed protein product [Rhodiola kirilowii]
MDLCGSGLKRSTNSDETMSLSSLIAVRSTLLEFR